jgi:pantoate--beta-alanine ligase
MTRGSTIGMGLRLTRALSDLGEALAGTNDVVLVPTMGALHDGHRALLRAARRSSGTVVMSLFVNPSQFAPGEDFERYPRDEARDLAIAADEGVDVVFAPGVETIYPDGFTTAIDPGPLGRELEGRSRPGHFSGVATVVTRLFGLVRPRIAFFGQKDFQQLEVIRRVVDDLALAVEIVGVPTVRDPDGLALSSRNVYLSAGERTRALSLYRGLQEAESLFARGERDPERLHAGARDLMAVEPEYLELRRRDGLGSYEVGAPAIMLVAARFGTTRLIDNVLLGPA